MNWGKVIVITLAIFGLFIAGMSVYMFATPQDDYDHEYYEKGLNFDKDYAREENVVKDDAQPHIRIDNSALYISFKNTASGTIKFERPSDTHMDRIFAVNTAYYIVPTAKLLPGEWQVVFEWKSGGHPYLYQQKIFIK